MKCEMEIVPSPLELTLTAHELFAVGPGTPATGPAIRVEAIPRDRPPFFALARLVAIPSDRTRSYDHLVFYRDEQRPENEIFKGGRVHIKAKDYPLCDEDLHQQLITITNRDTITRFWKSPDFDYGLALHYLGTGSVISQEGHFYSSLDFYWSRREYKSLFLEWSASDFHNFCEQLASDSTSELNFLLRWQSISPEEKTAFATHCEYGDWELLVRLCTWVFQMSLYHFESYTSRWGFWYETPGRYDSPAVFFLRRWQATLFKIIKPAFWNSTYPLCAHQWRMQKADVQNHVTCSVPTAHEFLEAQMGLREFLRPYLSAGEIEALFVP